MRAIKDQIARGIAEGEQGAYDREADINVFMGRLRQTRSRLDSRIRGLPNDTTLRAHLKRVSGQTLHTLLASEAWDTSIAGGEEVDVDWLLDG